MPSSVSKPDAIKYLNSGYVYQTYAEERDPAGNIKLFEDETKTTNQTISVEPITSQFSVETALKLFNTRFQYFEFPVEAVQTTMLKFDKELESEIKDTLSNTTFEQDVITRRMELLPVDKDTVLRYPVALAWTFEQGIVSSGYANVSTLDYDGYNANYYRSIDVNGSPVIRPSLFKTGPKSNDHDYGNRTAYFLSALNSWTEPEQTYGTTDGFGDAGKAKRFKSDLSGGWKPLRINGGNSPKANGVFRVTPEMIKQLKNGGWFVNTRNQHIWKRNLKFNIKINWRAEGGMENALQSQEWDANGVVLFVRMTSNPESYTWKVNGYGENGNAPVLAQSTSTFPIGIRTDDAVAMEPYLPKLNPTAYFNQSMEFTYVVDTNDLLFTDKGSTTPFGEYREYGLEVMCNYPVIIKDASFDVSVEQLPQDFDTENTTTTQYGGNNTSFRPYQSKYGAWAQQVMDNTTGRLNALTSIGGLRDVRGRNILCGTMGNTNDVVGWVNSTGQWKTLSTYSYPNGLLTKKTISSPLQFRFRLIENELFTQRRSIAYKNDTTGTYELDNYNEKKYYPGWKLLGRPHYPDDIKQKGLVYETFYSMTHAGNGSIKYDPPIVSKTVFNRNLSIIMKPK